MRSASVAELGRTLILAPHPDDETIGCGGLIALLGRAGVPAHVVLVTDGAGSHRHSRAYPAPRLRALRWREMVAALAELGKSAEHLSLLCLRDGNVPEQGQPGFSAAVGQLAHITKWFRPDTVVMPRRDDEHPDHRATHTIATRACSVATPRARRLEYAVWGGALITDNTTGHSTDNGTGNSTDNIWQIDISTVLDAKRRALAQHRSQLGQVIDDDPGGFTLPAELIDRCSIATETYFDTLHRR